MTFAFSQNTYARTYAEEMKFYFYDCMSASIFVAAHKGTAAAVLLRARFAHDLIFNGSQYKS